MGQRSKLDPAWLYFGDLMDFLRMRGFFPKFSQKRSVVKLGIWIVLGAGILFVALVWWCAGELAEPTRRGVQPVSLAYIDGSSRAGFRVDTFTSSGGMACVVCTPEETAVFSKRADAIRRQLEQRGIEPVPSGGVLGTLLILHGRGGIKEDYFPVAERFCAVGFRCVIPDLPGHGANPKKYSTYGFLEAEMVLKCFNEAAKEYGFTSQPSMLLGQSMGGSVAVYTAALKNSPFASMVVISSFDRLETVVRAQTDGFFGSVLGAAVRNSADEVFCWKTGVKISAIRPMDKAANIRIPTMVVHGESDDFVPTSSGRALFESFSGATEKQWVSIPTAGHNNVLVTDFPLYVTMAEWFLMHLGGGAPSFAPR